MALDCELKKRGIRETFRGQAWGDSSREWVYYDCVLDLGKLAKRFNFPECVEVHINNDDKSGLEAGFFCTQCKDAVMGVHPQVAMGKPLID